MLSGLAGKDVNHLMEATERVVASTDLDQLRQVAVEVLAGIVESPLVAWNEVCPRTGQIEAVTFPAMDPALYTGLGQAFALHVGDHPVITHHRMTADPRPWTISDFVDLAAFRHTGLYCEFYRPLAARDQLSFMLPHGRLIIGIAMNTAEGAVTDRERTLCRLLQPVLLQTYRHLGTRTRDDESAADFLERQGLTAREVEVMLLVRSSAPTKRIASHLGISPRTVEKHVEHALVKLGVASRLEAVSLLNR